MFEFVSGTLVSSHESVAVVDVQGIGYRLAVPAHYASRLPAPGSSVQLYTSFIVRETSHTLHGFLTTKERDFFELLLTINGVGPKLAMALMGTLTLAQLIQAVRQHDAKTLSQVPGVGRKTAERLVLEMGDKLLPWGFLEVEDTPALSSKKALQKPATQDAVSALVSLGYTQSAAQRAVLQVIGEEGSAEYELAQLITAALKK